MHEPLPDHSSLTRIRERYGIAIFRQFFEAIVERCRDDGLSWGKRLPIATRCRRVSQVSRMRYRDHYLVDGGKARIILGVLVTAADVIENMPFLDLVWRACFRWQLRPRRGSAPGQFAAALAGGSMSWAPGTRPI